MKIKYICKLCNKKFEGGRCFTSHLRSHNYTSKQYYDEFIKTEKDGICQVCGKPTVFFKFANGYRKTCSDECYRQLSVKNWRKTMNDKYNGGYYSGTDEYREKRKLDCLEKYNCEYYWQAKEIKEKRKESMLERYNVEHTMQKEEFKLLAKEHREETNLEKYGVEWTQQNPEIHKKQMYSKYHAPNGKVYDSSWEYLFEQYLIEKKIPYVYQADLTLVWTDIDGKEHRYIPDFSIITDKQELIEIKGDHFIENGVLIDPYNKTEKGYANARLKWECMMNAGVKIYTSKELTELGIL